MADITKSTTTTTSITRVNNKGIEFLPVRAGDVYKYDTLLFSDRICAVVSSEKYEHQYSGSVPKHHIVLSTLREGKILEAVMQPNEIMMRVGANGMARMPEEFPQKQVFAEQAKKGMVILIRGRTCQIKNLTTEKDGEKVVVHIQARTLDGKRSEDRRMPADAPLEFPGQQKAIEVVHKTLVEKGCDCVTRLDKGGIIWASTAVSADRPLEGRKVRVEVVRKEMIVDEKPVPNRSDSVTSTTPTTAPSEAAKYPRYVSSMTSSSSVATAAPSAESCRSKEYSKTGSSTESCGDCRDCNWYVRQWALTSRVIGPDR